MLTAILSRTGGALCSGYSARSRVRGHLEIYHAYIADGAAAQPEQAVDEPEERDWEMVNPHGTVEQPTQVTAERFFLTVLV